MEAEVSVTSMPASESPAVTGGTQDMDDMADGYDTRPPEQRPR